MGDPQLSEVRPGRAGVGAWVTYDVANTVFWTGVVGLSFPLWLTKELGGNDATLGYTLAAVMTVVLFTSPILGAISDQIGRKLPLLLLATLFSVGASLALGNGGLLVSLSLFALALCTMELGTIFYNALLAEVSTSANRGRISGLGTGIGYVGSFVAVAVALVLTEPKGYAFVIHVVAILFLIFSLPIFLFLRERPTAVLPSSLATKIGQAFVQMNRNLRELHRFPGLRRFLIGRFFYGTGINTTVAFAVVYASKTIGLSDREISLVLLAGISIAIPSGILWGTLVDRIGPGRVLAYSLLIWMGLMLFAVGIPWLSWTRHLWWIIGCMTGVAMAGVWTADRPYMLSLTPPEYTGEFFGLHATVGKLGRVVGPAMWALLADTLDLGRPAALLSLVGWLVVAYVILSRMKAHVPAPSANRVE